MLWDCATKARLGVRKSTEYGSEGVVGNLRHSVHNDNYIASYICIREGKT